jgi:hypothetical protein
MSTNLTVKYKDREISLNAESENTIKWVKEQLAVQTKIPILQQELSYLDGESKVVLTDN